MTYTDFGIPALFTLVVGAFGYSYQHHQKPHLGPDDLKEFNSKLDDLRAYQSSDVHDLRRRLDVITSELIRQGLPRNGH